MPHSECDKSLGFGPHGPPQPPDLTKDTSRQRKAPTHKDVEALIEQAKKVVYTFPGEWTASAIQGLEKALAPFQQKEAEVEKE